MVWEFKKRNSLKNIKKHIPEVVKAAPVPKSGPAENEIELKETLETKEKSLVWIFSIICALLVYAGIAVIVQNVYTPDISLLKVTAGKILIGNGGYIRPEPVEAMLSQLALIIIPLSLLGFYVLFSKMPLVKKLAGKPFFMFLSTISVACIIAMVYYDFAAQNPFGKGNGDMPQTDRDFTAVTNFDFYFDGLFLGNHLVLYTLIIVPLISSLFFIGLKKYNWQDKKLFKITSSILGYSVLSALIICCVLMDIFYFPYQPGNKYNLNAVYYSMTQVYAGMPLLVNGFTNTYGLYPHFLNLIFHIIGLSVFKFSLVMATLLGLSFILNFYCLKQFVNNKVILFLGMFSVIYFPFLNVKFVEHFDAVFAYFPIRYIIPSILIFSATLYLKKRSQLVYWSSSSILAILVLWNPEFGIVSYISWLSFHTFNDFYNKEGKVNFKKILSHWLAGAVILIIVTYLYKLLIYAFYASAPDMGVLWDTIFIFGKLGFGLLPMALVHPWNLIVLVLIFGFLFSIVKWYKKENNPKASVVFLLSILGVGIFFYFQGRSHNWYLATSSGISLMLLTILGDELWTTIKNKNILPLSALFIVFIYVISISFFEIVTNMDKLIELVYQKDDKNKDSLQVAEVENNRDFITKYSKEFEKIYILTISKYQGLYFDASKRRSAFNPGVIELFFNKDLARLENQIIDSSFSVFITPYTFQHLRFMDRPLAALAATYEYKDANKVIAFLNKRKTKILAKVFFDTSNGLVFHRKYNDDSVGTEMRISDALGTKPIELNLEFSIQILFDSKSQVFPMPALIGNMSGSNGFAISKTLNSPNYIFGINGLGYNLPVPNNEWVYCVMNVFPDHFEVYINGDLLSTNPLSKPYTNSTDLLRIGNLGYTHFYVGAISEVAIANKALDNTQIEKTWNEIKNGM